MLMTVVLNNSGLIVVNHVSPWKSDRIPAVRNSRLARTCRTTVFPKRWSSCRLGRYDECVRSALVDGYDGNNRAARTVENPSEKSVVVVGGGGGAI